jgi:hypothetical protein
VLELDSGEQSNIFVKVPTDELLAWDAAHDVAGRRIGENYGALSHGDVKRSDDVEASSNSEKKIA